MRFWVSHVPYKFRAMLDCIMFSYAFISSHHLKSAAIWFGLLLNNSITAVQLTPGRAHIMNNRDC